MSTEELLLQECKNQLEYLNQKFTATGTTNSLLTKLDAYFSAKERWEGIEKRERILPTATPAANQEKKIVWEERRDHWRAETQGGILLLATSTDWELWESGATIVTADAPTSPPPNPPVKKHIGNT